MFSIRNTMRKTIYFYILSRHLYLFVKGENQISWIIYDIFSGVYNIGLIRLQSVLSVPVSFMDQMCP